ncbi:Transketolase [Rhodotorula kratochvilovae]
MRTTAKQAQMHMNDQPHASTSQREPIPLPRVSSPAPPAHRASSAAVARVANEIRLRSIQVPDRTGPRASYKSGLQGAASQDEDVRDEREEQPPKKRRRGVKTVWYTLRLVPDLGTSPRFLMGQQMRRFDLISEYIRRQTGESRTPLQVQGYIRNTRKTATDTTLISALQGANVSDQEIERIDWDSLLGPDHFPQTKPHTSATPPNALMATAFKEASTSRSRSPTAKVPKLENSTTPGRPVPPPTPVPCAQQFLPPAPPQSSFSAPSVSPQAYSQVPVPPPSAYYPPPPAPLSAYPRPAATSTHTSTVHSSLSPLLAFLSASSPGRDHSLAAHILLEGGITSLSALADLLLLDQNSLDGFFELLSRRTRVGGMQLAWLKKVVAEAREASCRRREGDVA